MSPREALDENRMNSWTLPDPVIQILGVKYAFDPNEPPIKQIWEIADKQIGVDVFSIIKLDKEEYRITCSIGYFYAFIK